jgi:hypothetical protein
MRKGTPNSPREFDCFGLLTHIALNRLLSQVYQADIAGPCLLLTQVSTTWISWRLGSDFYQFRTMDARGREPPILPGNLTVLVYSLTLPWSDCCCKSIKLISQDLAHQQLRWVSPDYHGVWGATSIDLWQWMHEGGNPRFAQGFWQFWSTHSHCLESIVVAGLSNWYCRTFLINNSGEYHPNIMAFEERLLSI